MTSQRNSIFNLPRRHQKAGARRTVLAVLALACAPLAMLHAQTSTLGRAFPLYASGLDMVLFSGSIFEVDSAGNSSVFAPLGGGQYPTFLAFDASGNLYVSEAVSHQILKVDPAGNQTVFASGGYLDEPYGLAFDASGNLYVVNYVSTNDVSEIVRIDPSGNQSVFTSGGLLVLINGGVPAFGPDGSLYVTSATSGTLTGAIVKVDSSGGQTYLSYGGSLYPGSFGLAFDAMGNLYESSSGFYSTTGASAIVKIDPSGNQSTFASGGNLMFFNVPPLGLAFDSSGNLYVASCVNSNCQTGVIVKLDPNGNQTVFESAGSIPISLAFTRQAGYTFSGFLSPTGNPPVVNTGNAGRTYSIKWQLKNSSGAYVTALSAVKSISYQSVSCNNFSWSTTDSLTATASGNSSLRYDSTANQYVYNWATPSQPGCYVLTVSFDTGQSFSADFNLK